MQYIIRIWNVTLVVYFDALQIVARVFFCGYWVVAMLFCLVARVLLVYR